MNKKAAMLCTQPPCNDYGDFEVADDLGIPAYLEETYWWAYLHPGAVSFFERQWLVNLILWGNFSRLRDAALNEIGSNFDGETLQVACVYGDFSQRAASRLTEESRLDIVDVAPVQLENVRKKVNSFPNVFLHHGDSSNLRFENDSFDNIIVFFLLHEQPEEIRKRTVREALRVVRPGGKVVFVDYHNPRRLNPFRYIMIPVLYFLEPFALGVWKHEIADWLPKVDQYRSVHKETFFGSLYQKVTIVK